MKIAVASIAALCLFAANVATKPETSPALSGYQSQYQPENTVITFPNENRAAPNKNCTQNDPPQWYTPLERPEWWLVILGFPTLVIVIYQSIQIRKSADAAKQSAEVFINSERSWIMADLIATSVPLEVSENVKGRATEQTAIHVYLVFKNDGKTPAWITGKFFKARVVESIPDMPDLDSGDEGDFYDISLEPVGVGETKKSPAWNLWCNGRISEATPILIVYGYVKYRDVFSSDRQTRFGYSSYKGGQLERIQAFRTLWEYNRYT